MKHLSSKIHAKCISMLLALSLVIGVIVQMPAKTVKAETVARATVETAWFPVSELNVTQLAFESYSHGNSQHIDCVGGTYAFAPFTGKFVAQSSNYGVALFQSINKVKFANGVEDYMTVMFMHGTPQYSNNITVSQGTNIYKIGGIGKNGAQDVYAKHYDIGVQRGKVNSFPSTYSSFGKMYPYDAFVINTSKTKVVQPGVMASGNHMTNGAPSNYNGKWRMNNAGTGGSVSSISVTYQVYDTTNKAWLPNVTNSADYAGVFGHSISAVYANLSSGNITYRVHVKGGSWLPEVKNRTDYAGAYAKPIDGLMMKTDTGKTIHYQVHIKGGNWLGYVTGYNTSDGNNGYAGVFGKEIDGIRIYLS